MNIPLAKKPVLTEEDWNFSKERVPDDELVPCLLWEFFRESPVAQQLINDWINLPDKPDSEQEKLWKRMKTLCLRVNHEIHLQEFINSALGPAFKYGGLKKGPWQNLHPQARKRLSGFANNVNPPVFISTGDFHLGPLAQMVAKQVKKLDDEYVSGSQYSLPEARGILEIGTWGKKWEAMCIVVDWTAYDDETIRKAFAKLAAGLKRPPGIIPRKRTGAGLGNPNEWRGKLNSLGRTRIHCHYNGVQALKRADKAAH